jgi:cytochrome P450
MMSTVRQIEDIDDPNFNPFLSDEISFGDIVDLHARLTQLRKEASVHSTEYRMLFSPYPDLTLGQFKHYTVLGYDEVAQVYNDPATFSNGAWLYNIGLTFGRSISTMDAPEHPRYRRIFQKIFLPQNVSKWSTSLIDPVVSGLIGGFIDRGAADLVQEFTLHYPFQIIYRQLGLPSEDVKTFHKLAIAQQVITVDFEHATEASKKLGTYFQNLIEERRRNPGEDLVSLLGTAEVDGERLPDEILISFLRQLVTAAGDTTYRTLSSLLVGLLTNPDQLQAVTNDRGLVPQAIEEALRWEGTVTLGHRMTTRDTILGGVSIPSGSVIDVIAGSANRDETKFPDPDRFNIFRERKHRHFGFAAGPHVCIGQHLARLEMNRAIEAILDRLPNLRLDPEKPAPVIKGFMMRVPEHVYVRFG